MRNIHAEWIRILPVAHFPHSAIRILHFNPSFGLLRHNNSPFKNIDFGLLIHRDSAVKKYPLCSKIYLQSHKCLQFFDSIWAPLATTLTTEFMYLLRKAILVFVTWHDKVVCRRQQQQQQQHYYLIALLMLTLRRTRLHSIKESRHWVRWNIK